MVIRPVLRNSALAVAVSIVAGCTHGSDAPAVNAQWRADLAQLLPAVAAVHPDLQGGVPVRLRAEVASLRARASALGGDAVMTGVMRLMTHIASTGRDGHTGFFVWGAGNPPVHSLPLRWWFFPDGLYVEDQLGGSALVGSRVVSIAGHPLADVIRRVDPLVPHDNSSTVTTLRPRFLLVPEVLHGLGLIDHVGPVPLDLVDRTGARRTVQLSPVDIATYNAWAGPYGLHLVPHAGAMYLSHLDADLWHTLLPGHRELYIGFNQVEALDADEVARIRRLARSPKVDRLIVDVRHNVGGEVGEGDPLLDLLREPRVRSKQLYLLVGRNTFSAAALFAAQVVALGHVTTVGEPTGGAPTSYGNSTDVLLEHTGYVLSVASTREYAVGPGDTRTAIEPDLPVQLSARDYFAGRDPVLQAALDDAR